MALSADLDTLLNSKLTGLRRSDRFTGLQDAPHDLCPRPAGPG